MLLRALTDLIRQGVDAQDGAYVDQAVAALWRAADLEFLPHMLDVDMEPFPGQEDEEDAATRARRAVLREIGRTRGALALSVAAWVCHKVRTDGAAPTFANRVLALLRERLGDADALWASFVAAVDADNSRDLPLFRWHLDEAREGEVISYSGSPDLALAFVLMVLPSIPAGFHQRIDALAPLRNASWLGGQVNRALQEIGGDPER